MYGLSINVVYEIYFVRYTQSSIVSIETSVSKIIVFFIRRMPHTDRPKCVGCGGTIRTSRIRYLSSNLLKIFVSIEYRKRVRTSDAICDSCRWKYVEWKKAMMGDFDDLEVEDGNFEINEERDETDGMVR